MADTLKLYVFTYNLKTINVEEVEVKETPTLYRCVNKNEYPFQYTSQVKKHMVGSFAFEDFSNIVYYSFDPSIEIFKEKVMRLFDLQIGKLRSRMLDYQKGKDNFIEVFEEKTVKHHAEILATKEIVEIYQFYQNGIGYVGDNGIKIVFNGDFKQID